MNLKPEELARRCGVVCLELRAKIARRWAMITASMMMAEWIWEDVESFEHVLALLYQAAWVCAELREHLKQFEDKEDADGTTDL